MTKWDVLRAELIVELRENRALSSWKRGVIKYALELLENVEEVITEEKLLNGAKNWQEYSNGCSLIYDCDIAKRLCSPCELKKKKDGNLNPSKNETWIDVQTRALSQAAHLILEKVRKSRF